MNRDKKILLGLTIFICSIISITIIKGTYAYPSTMENTSGGKVVPLGNEGGGSQCWECDGDQVTGTSEYPPQWSCSSGWKTCSTSTPTPTPTSTPTPTHTPTPTPTRTPVTPSSPIIPVEYPACYVCSSDETNYEWSKYSNLPNTCSGRWNETNKSMSECKYVPPSSTPNSYCYVCSTDDNKFYWGIYPVPSSISSSCSGTWKGTARTQEQCHAGDIPSNPNTGDVMLYIAYLIGFSSLFYSGYSFYRYKKQNNK